MGNRLPKPTAVELLKERQANVDGAFGVSQANLPDEANDIGDVDECSNPSATDLDHVDAAAGNMQHSEDDGMHTFYDGPNVVLAGSRYVCVDDGSLIDDITNWA
jgi:hypothetical protein